MGKFITDNMLQVLGDDIKDYNDFKSSINLAVSELGQLLGEQSPYEFVDALHTDVAFNNNFIDKLLYVMATDVFEILNKKELDIWNKFIKYEDGDTTMVEILSKLDKRFVDIYNNVDKRTTKVLFRDLVDIYPEEDNNA